MSDENRSKRWPLTGTLFVEFVDAADPEDATVAPNFGTFGTKCEPAAWHDDSRLPALLRWLADSIESDQMWKGIPKDDFVFPDRWRQITGGSPEDEASRLLLRNELEREVAREHLLFGRVMGAVAFCLHCDDVIIELDDGGFAVVHLTWPDNGPDRPPWPQTVFHATWAGVAAYVREHEDA